MASSIGLFLLNSPQHVSSMPSIVERLQQAYNTIGPTPFALEYRCYRAIIISNDEKASKEARWQHFLHLHHIPNQAFRLFEHTNGAEQFSVSSIPEAHINDYKTLMAQRMAALWTPRTNVIIPKGMTFDVGDVRIRIGEARAEGAGPGTRGILVAIQLPMNEAAVKEDEDVSKAIITEVWKVFGVEGAREAWGFGGEKDILKAWCDVFKGGK